MAATVRIDESNGAGETITNGISNMNYGSTDAPNLTIDNTTVIVAGQNSMTKYWKFEVTSMGGSNQIDTLELYKSAGAYVTGEGIQCNLRTSSYGGGATYVTPTQTTYTDQALATADPAAANWGIAGTLAGTIVAPGKSDYMKRQLQTTSSSPPGNVNQKTMTIKWNEQ
jgi:hypothetical protein